MNEKEFDREIIRRISRLEDAAFGKKKKQTAAIKSLADHTLALRERGGFGQPLVAQEVHKKLQASYSCDLSRVKVELIRMQKRGQLRKTSKFIDGKKYIAYVW